MSNQAAKQNEKLTAKLFDDYLTQRLAGGEPSVTELLAECPESQRSDLEDAVSGANAYISEYFLSYVRPSVLEKTRLGLEGIKRKKERQREIHERVRSIWEIDVTDPTIPLLHIFNISHSGTQPNASPLLRAYNRGETVTSVRNSALRDHAWLRARQPVLSAKAEETLERALIDGAPVDLQRVVQRLYLVVEQGPMDGALEGMLVTDGEIGAVLINTKIDNDQRRRFTLAHEIGHFVLHKDKQSFTDTAHQLRDYVSTVEAEANIFASMLLMPQFLLPQGCGREKPTLQQADDLSDRFDVSYEAALRRIIGLSNWRSALVISKDGAVVSSARSELFDGFISHDRKPHPATMARMLLNTDGPNEDATVLDASVWVEGPLAEEDVQIYEQSRRLTNGFVYSLLTVLDPD